MRKALVFDMDGTIADLYNYKDWLNKLEAGSTEPYNKCNHLFNGFDWMTLLKYLRQAQNKGWKIEVITWTGKGADKEFSKRIKTAKIEWLQKHNFPYDSIHCVRYGARKQDSIRGKYTVAHLVDDNAQVRNTWTLGEAIDPTENLIEKIKKLIEN